LFYYIGVFVYYKSQDKHSIKKIDTPQQQKSFIPKPKDIIVEKKVQNKKEKTIYISREINTTIKTQITLKSNFDKNSKEYNYIWKEGENIIGVGKVHIYSDDGNYTREYKLDDKNRVVLIKGCFGDFFEGEIQYSYAQHSNKAEFFNSKKDTYALH